MAERSASFISNFSQDMRVMANAAVDTAPPVILVVGIGAFAVGRPIEGFGLGLVSFGAEKFKEWRDKRKIPR